MQRKRGIDDQIFSGTDASKLKLRKLTRREGGERGNVDDETT